MTVQQSNLDEGQQYGRGSEEPRPLPPDGPRWHSGYREAADDEMPVAGMTINVLLERRVRERPDATYLVFEDREGGVIELTYAEFAAGVEAGRWPGGAWRRPWRPRPHATSELS